MFPQWSAVPLTSSITIHSNRGRSLHIAPQWSCVAHCIFITITTIIRWIFKHLKQHKIVKSHSMIASVELRLLCCIFFCKIRVYLPPPQKTGLWIHLYTNEDFLCKKNIKEVYKTSFLQWVFRVLHILMIILTSVVVLTFLHPELV